MDEIEIYSELNELEAKMLEKGLKKPEATARFRSNEGYYVTIRWDDGSSFGKSKIFNYRETNPICESFDLAFEYIEKLPTVDEIRRREFIQAVAHAAELGKEANVDINNSRLKLEAL